MSGKTPAMDLKQPRRANMEARHPGSRSPLKNTGMASATQDKCSCQKTAQSASRRCLQGMNLPRVGTQSVSLCVDPELQKKPLLPGKPELRRACSASCRFTVQERTDVTHDWQFEICPRRDERSPPGRAGITASFFPHGTIRRSDLQ